MDGVRNWGNDYGQTAAGSGKFPPKDDAPAPAAEESPVNSNSGDLRQKGAIGGQLGNIWESILGK